MALQRIQARSFAIPWADSTSGHVTLGFRALVAEDDDAFRTLLCEELCREGLEVVGCATAPEVVRQNEWIQTIEGDPWSLDVVVTDLRLGEGDGLSLLQRLVDAHADVPVVIVSAFGDFESRIRAGELGAAAFLDKPIEMEKLRALVHRVAKERQGRVQRAAGEANRSGPALRSP